MSCQNLSIAGGFYEIGGYKNNIKRIKDGVDELDEVSKMVKERADIEAKYGKSLQQWHEKWVNHVDSKVPEGVIKTSWAKVLDEGNELSKVHIGVKERFHDEIIKTIALFKKENHHSRPFGGQSKEIHEISEAFEKAQKQWKKLFEKVESARKTYHSACRSEKSAIINYSNSQADTSVSADANEKLRDRLEKCKEEVRKAKGNYEVHVTEAVKYKNVYIENMGFVFEKCQQMELKRMQFAMEMISAIQNVLSDVVEAQRLQGLHREMKDRFRSVGESDYQADLKEWSKLHGVDAPMQWPVFEEYTPEMRQITHKQTKDAGGIVLTKRVINSDEFPETPAATHKSAGSSSTASSRPISTSSSLANSATNEIRPQLHREPSSGSSSQENENILDNKFTSKSLTVEYQETKVLQTSNRVVNSPFADPFPMRTPETRNTVSSVKAVTDNSSKKSVSQASSGTTHTYDSCVDTNMNDCDDEVKYGDFPGSMRGPAKALYDYIPIEGDEMPLKKGEIVEVISGPDHLGWCMGKKDSDSGLFPASYVSPV